MGRETVGKSCFFHLCLSNLTRNLAMKRPIRVSFLPCRPSNGSPDALRRCFGATSRTGPALQDAVPSPKGERPASPFPPPGVVALPRNTSYAHAILFGSYVRVKTLYIYIYLILCVLYIFQARLGTRDLPGAEAHQHGGYRCWACEGGERYRCGGPGAQQTPLAYLLNATLEACDIKLSPGLAKHYLCGRARLEVHYRECLALSLYNSLHLYLV